MGLLGKTVSIGLDLGSHRIKALQIEKSNGGYRIVRSASAPTPPDCLRDGVVTDASTLAEAIKTMLKDADLPATAACIAAAGSAVYVRPVVLPKMPEAALRKSIQLEAHRYIPGSAEDSYIEIEVLSNLPDNQINVLIVAAPRDIVESRIQSCEEAGLDVDVVDIEIFAAYRSLLEVDPEFSALSSTVGIVDIGASSSTVSVVHQGVFAMHRSIPHGSRALTEALAQTFGLAPEAAEDGKAQLDVSHLVGVTTLPDNPPLRVLHPHLEDLVREVRRSINFFQSQANEEGQMRQVDRLLITGGGARLAGLDLYLDHRLSMPVIEKGLFDNPRFTRTNAEQGRGLDLSVAAGLALRAKAA